MNIVSFELLGFVLGLMVLYYLLPVRFQNYLLLAASSFFLLTWSAEFFLVYAVLSGLNYLLAFQVASEDQTRQRLALWGGIALNVLALAYFKYSDFFINDLVELLGGSALDGEQGSLKILLPIGLSFVIVQTISYLLDVQKKLVEPIQNFGHFALYMIYFPKIVSGPIERAKEFIPRLEAQRVLDDEKIAHGTTLILIGLFRKVAIADMLILLLPEGIFETPENFKSVELVFGLLVYSFMLYNDFAGYTSLVRGISYLFGLELSSNFNIPYFARNFTEFWQRWHITLSDWLRDYIFMPLTRGLLRRKYKSRHPLTIILPPITTMLVSALWHGVGLGMLLWGLLHGIYQVIERFRAVQFGSVPPQNLPRWRQAAAMLTVFVLVVLAWVPFRMELPVALEYWEQMFTGWTQTTAETLVPTHLYIAALILILMPLSIDVVQYRYGEFAYLRLPPLGKAILINVSLLIIFVAIGTPRTVLPPFIYQGF